MNSDPVIDQVRAVRKAISAAYGHDAGKMIADHIKLQQRFAARLVWPAAAQRRPRVPRGKLAMVA